MTFGTRYKRHDRTSEEDRTGVKLVLSNFKTTKESCISGRLDELGFPAEAAVCNDVGECNHRKEIEKYYEEITNVMTVACRVCIPCRKQWHAQRPGWNSDVR